MYRCFFESEMDHLFFFDKNLIAALSPPDCFVHVHVLYVRERCWVRYGCSARGASKVRRKAMKDGVQQIIRSVLNSGQ